MKTRIDVIKHLIDRFGYKSYLEIGIQYMQCWNEIECEKKVGVEPNVLPDDRILALTSDQFFERNTDTFDIIFIDGDHSHEQALRDIRNSFKILNPGGIIVCHDTYPPNLDYTNIMQCGTVYKAICDVRSEGGVEFCTYIEDFGVCTMRPGRSLPMEVRGIPFEYFHQMAEQILNLKDWDGFVKYYE